MNVVLGGAAGGGKTQMLGDLHNAMTKAVTATARREPVAPWRLFGSPGCASCSMFLGCDRDSWTVARYVRRETASSSLFSCEACAERAGVFGPVFDGPSMVGLLREQQGRCDEIEQSLAPAFPPAGWKVFKANGWDAPVAVDAKPTCAGPLDTHGTPVLRVTYWLGTRKAKVMLCDACYLDFEARTFRCEEGYRQSREWNAMNDASHEPTARVGTVPQSLGLGAGIGIWASRGMR